MISRKKFLRLVVWLTAFGLCLALVTSPTSNPLAKGDAAYEKLKIFSEVLSLVSNSYVEEVDPEKLVYGAIRGMMKELDPHSAFMTADMFKEMQVDTKGEFGGLGITIGIKDEVLTVIAPIEDTPAWKIGIKAGDQILKVDDEPTKTMTIQDAVKKMRGTPGTSVTINIMREDFEEPKDFTIVRDIIKLKSVKYRMLSDGIAFVRVTQFQERTSQDLQEAIEILSRENKISGLLLDLRNNPGGLLDQAVKVSSLFLPANVNVVSTKGRKAKQNMEFKSIGGDRIPGVPMIVLVNHGSASASEIVAGALQDWGRAIILGTKTFGKGSVQTVIPLEDNSGLRLTTAKYYTPKDRSIQNTGIDPDLVVPQATITPRETSDRFHAKEEDLEGHLDNDQIKESDVSADEVVDDKLDMDDYQLQRAVDILKSWTVFQKLKTPAETSALK